MQLFDCKYNAVIWLRKFCQTFFQIIFLKQDYGFIIARNEGPVAAWYPSKHLPVQNRGKNKLFHNAYHPKNDLFLSGQTTYFQCLTNNL
jgi:hypothetical protein